MLNVSWFQRGTTFRGTISPRVISQARYAAKLRCEYVQAALIPHNVIRLHHFLFDWPLSGEAVFDLFRRPASLQQPLVLSCGRARNANDRVELGLSAGFKQQRNHDDRPALPVGTPGLQPASPKIADTWMR